MKQILLIGSLLMLVSSCEQAAITAVLSTVFLNEANKPLADEETGVEPAEENTQLDGLEVENLRVSELD